MKTTTHHPLRLVKRLALALAVMLAVTPILKAQEQPLFSFAFFTDIHLSKADNRCFQGLAQAIAKAKNLGVDFIITGGDNVNIDVLKTDSLTAHQLFKEFKEVVGTCSIPVYTAIGNHDRFAVPTSPLADAAMYESYLGKSYYSFNHKGWHFVVLNTVQKGKELRYPCIGEEQLQWLNTDLGQPENQLPTIAIAHVPLLTTCYAAKGEKVIPDLVSNGKEVWDLLAAHKLQLVLQGHKHVYEALLTAGTQFVAGGAISAAWWGGAFREGTEEGFVLVNVYKNGTYSWQYVDYDWVVEKKAS